MRPFMGTLNQCQWSQPDACEGILGAAALAASIIPGSCALRFYLQTWLASPDLFFLLPPGRNTWLAAFCGVAFARVDRPQTQKHELCLPCAAFPPAQVLDTLHKGHQAMVFVHSRKDTGKTARTLVAKAQNGGDTDAFDCTQHEQYAFMLRDIRKSRNRCAPRAPDQAACAPPDLATRRRTSSWEHMCH